MRRWTDPQRAVQDSSEMLGDLSARRGPVVEHHRNHRLSRSLGDVTMSEFQFETSRS